MWEVLKTSEHVARESRLVEIKEDALAGFSEKLLKQDLKVPAWNTRYHLTGSHEAMVSYLFVLDSMNFCFWPPAGKSKWEIEYGSKPISGYYALAASLRRAVESGVPITEAGYLADLSLDTLRHILDGRGTLQLLEQRLESLRALGEVLLRDYGGKAQAFVESADKSALHLARQLAGTLPSFRDVAQYGGETVFFYKRAQILAADLYGAFDGQGWGSFRDIDELTAFADYKVPQVLRHLGILCYEPPLAHRVDQQIPIEPGSLEEVEIRACTIWAVELIRQELEKMGKRLRAFEIDWILWDLGQDQDFKKKPFHRTVTIFY
ncbi:MAG: queuosine 5'-phosphate N-glycosylase/hydrolase [bacterium]